MSVPLHFSVGFVIFHSVTVRSSRLKLIPTSTTQRLSRAKAAGEIVVATIHQ